MNDTSLQHISQLSMKTKKISRSSSNIITEKILHQREGQECVCYNDLLEFFLLGHYTNQHTEQGHRDSYKILVCLHLYVCIKRFQTRLISKPLNTGYVRKHSTALYSSFIKGRTCVKVKLTSLTEIVHFLQGSLLKVL